MIAKTAVGVLIGGGFYWLLIDTRSLPELYALAGVALLCGLAYALSREQRFTEARIQPSLLAGAWRLALQVPRDVVWLCTEALAQLVRPRPARGCFRAVPFTPGQATPTDAGRRALTDALGSVAPNTVVLGVDTEHGLLIVHQLRRQGGQRDVDVMGLG